MTPKKQNHTFTHNVFNLSTDYKLLWESIFKGHRIPAWIVYSDEYEKPIWDLVEVKMAYGTDDRYAIGVRGISYDGWYTNSFEDFENTCKAYSLHFIVPVNK